VIAAWASGDGGTPVDGELCRLQVENPLIPVVQNSRATSVIGDLTVTNCLLYSASCRFGKFG
jgi:hypothetical protein